MVEAASAVPDATQFSPSYIVESVTAASLWRERVVMSEEPLAAVHFAESANVGGAGRD